MGDSYLCMSPVKFQQQWDLLPHKIELEKLVRSETDLHEVATHNVHEYGNRLYGTGFIHSRPLYVTYYHHNIVNGRHLVIISVPSNELYAYLHHIVQWWQLVALQYMDLTLCDFYLHHSKVSSSHRSSKLEFQSRFVLNAPQHSFVPQIPINIIFIHIYAMI